MKFNLDTDKCEDIKLSFDQYADFEENIMDFCFGISALYTDFCMQLGLDQDQARSLLEVCQSCMTRNVEELLAKGLLDDEDDDDGVSEEELDELEHAMRAAGFSTEETSNIVALFKDVGSIDAALGVLKGIGEDAGVDWAELGMDD